jgi:hypothetical protein
MTKSRTKPIELSDLWRLDGWDTMSNISSRFHEYVTQNGGISSTKAKRSLSSHSKSILKDLWSSPLVQILALMYFAALIFVICFYLIFYAGIGRK